MIVILDEITEPIKIRCSVCGNPINDEHSLYCSSCQIEDEFNQWAEAQNKEGDVK